MGTEAHWVEANGKTVDENTGADEASFVAIPAVPAELTASSILTVDGTYDADTATVINNLRTRVDELETALIAAGLLGAP